MTRSLRRLILDRSAATAVEYSLIIGIIGLVVVAGFGAVSTELTNLLIRVRDAMISP